MATSIMTFTLQDYLSEINPTLQKQKQKNNPQAKEDPTGTRFERATFCAENKRATIAPSGQYS